jgi:hypothetical protein
VVVGFLLLAVSSAPYGECSLNIDKSKYGFTTIFSIFLFSIFYFLKFNNTVGFTIAKLKIEL